MSRRQSRKSPRFLRHSQKKSRRKRVTTLVRSPSSSVVTEAKPEWEVLVRTIQIEDISRMFSEKGIYGRIPFQDHYWYPGVYTHFLSSKLEAKRMKEEWHFTNRKMPIVLVFDRKVLQDLPFTICRMDMAGGCMDPYETQEFRQENTLMNSKGHRKTAPDMTPLTEWINMFLDPKPNPVTRRFVDGGWSQPITKWNSEEKKWVVTGRRRQTWRQRKTYMWSHEIIFPMIPLKYLRHILVYNPGGLYLKAAIEKYFPSIPITVIDRLRTRHRVEQEIFPLMEYIATTSAAKRLKESQE